MSQHIHDYFFCVSQLITFKSKVSSNSEKYFTKVENLEEAIIMIMGEDLNNRNLNSGEMFWRYPVYPNSLLSTTEEKK